MIEFLKGILVQQQPARLTISVGGVGFGLDVSLRTSEAFSRIGEAVEIITYLHVKEDILELYGFRDEVEKTLFLKLLGVSGIGPRLALRILSSTSPEQLAALITQGDVRGLTALKGVGKKTAEVMIASLRAGIAKMDFQSRLSAAGPPDKLSESIRDAIQALMTLGVKDAQAQSSVQKAATKLGAMANTSQLITLALQDV